MGFRGEAGSTRRAQPELADACFRQAADLARKMVPALPGNRELIDHIHRHGLHKI
jgi:hypothetical protein